MGSLVARWTGREARAFREAKRMSVREFAAHLGVNDAAVSNWERRGTRARLRYDTQQLLDTDLTRSEPEVADRFELILRSETPDDPTAQSQPQDETAASGIHFGGRSGQRTASLLDAARTTVTESTYHPDQTALERFRRFLDSQARVFVLTGATGSGKTLLTQYLAHRWSEHVDFQLHTCSTWALSTMNLATEILRYASLSGGEDALLTLERASHFLERPCVVVIDGVDTQEHLTSVGRHIDGILRQAHSDRLRFLVVVRTSPEPDLSPFPVLSAAAFGHVAQPSRASHTMEPWTLAEARELWDRERHADQIPFSDLPESLRYLARTPLYMRMLRTAGDTTPVRARPGAINAFRLVDHCVCMVLGRGSHDIGSDTGRFTRLARELMPEAIPGPLAIADQQPEPVRASKAPAGEPVFAFVERASDGRERFTHDVFREYFLAVHIVEQMTARGRSIATVAAFNDLADHAARSAAARGVFDFVVCALDCRAPNLVGVIAMAPSIDLDAALPMLLETAAASGALVSAEVVRSCARRCTQTATHQLARALLATPHLGESLGEQYAPWIVEQLRTHGFGIWDEVARHVEHALDIQVSTRIVDCIDLDQAEEAAFLARHFDLFAGARHDHADLLQRLLRHLDWRVRAGLAEALLGHRGLSSTFVNRVVEHLVHDDDYKVRAAIARAVGTLDTVAVHDHVQALLSDGNWHVRERTLQGLLEGPRAPLPHPEVAHAVMRGLAADKGWDAAPASTAKLLARMRLLNGGSAHEASPSEGGALFGLLRELRTGWIELPSHIEQSLISQGKVSSHWLTAREAHAAQQRTASPRGEPSARERYRRRRGQRSIQVALDVHNLDRAVEVATASADAGVDLLEVGDPLIKRAGVAAIEAVKRHAPDAAVVAEMMSADWGRDQVELAAEAGADVVLLIGPASIASVSAAVAAARRLGVALTLDVAAERLEPSWLRDMERTGVDGFVVTTNIDLGVGGNHPLATARMIRSRSRLPVAVSGGFSTTDDALTASDDWDIVIVGRSVADAVAPSDMAHQLTTIVHQVHTEERP
ncbi:orotidine 5'-phosphate decarboxylase / HUMPS family protein [Nocardiopsis metallicus]|uniref:3-keto-L-gulonate-6-phosphate decarboxylase/transcriptional regulator with XRE-family HTH domain n=1 Tax=Nocardiopsis metallicus TaxID=179819 RepID=A0A840WA72_9ACTN|nr:orotidine 5'-phosphate decarboxylase / HUMPS family protein [Nocardiopsis metallicus]MBB5493950.1 3-keto-L-gulonate-6-phosphate decarboxylase/transcriptional regulator with XRE-family HTH domain [Nocardiopsis metallicus]